MKTKIIALIKDGFLHIMGGSILIKLMGFLSSIFIVRLVSKEAYGCLAYADNLYSYASIVTGLGLSTAILVKCTKNSLEKENSAYFKYALSRGICIQIICSIMVLGYYIFSSKNFTDAKPMVAMLFLYPTASYVMQCITNYVRAYQLNKMYSYSAVIQSVVLLIGSVSLALVFNVYGIILARYFAILALVLYVRKFIISHLNIKTESISRVKRKEFLFLGCSLLVTSLFSELMYSNEMFLVNSIIGDEVVTADYKIATLIPAQIIFVTQSLMTYFIPKFSEYKDEKSYLWKYSVKVGIFNAIIIVLLCIIAVACTPIVIRLLYGERYIGCINLSIKFWIAYAINASFRIVPLNVLAMTGGEKTNAILSVTGCGIHFIIAKIALEKLSLEFLPLALSGAFIFIGIISWYKLREKCLEGDLKCSK